MVLTSMYTVFVYAQHLVLSVLVDALLFLCVDKLCKVVLDKCRTPQEKRDIWLFESLVLLGLSAGVLAYSHIPVVLWILCTVTFISATLTGRIDFIYYWESLKNYWNEFSDQEESMHAMYQEAVCTTPEPVYKNQVSDDQNKEFLRQTGEINISNSAVGSTSVIGEGLKALKYNEKKAKYEYVGVTKQAASKSSGDEANSKLRRRPVANPAAQIVTSVQPEEERDTPSLFHNLENIGTKVWKSLGFQSNAQPTNLPPGLNSAGRNLCFLNSVLQCVARAPNLADDLADELKSCSSQDRHRLALLDAIAETLQQVNVMPSENTTPTVDTTELCRAGAKVNPDLLSSKNKYQMQQDACEFLSWLLYEVHEAINDTKTGKGRWNHDMAMSALKTVYGNISESYTKVMKKGCIDQISRSNGLADPEIAEPVQNLCNMEWITHRRANRSVIDDLFTFQSVALQMCATCNHTSATVQTMNILPIPVENQDACVPLGDCIASFTSQEKLSGRDGLQCDKCQTQAAGRIPQTPAGVQTRSAVLRTVHSDISATPLSPIQAQADSTVHYQAANFLASTPLHPSGKGVTKSAPSLSAKIITEGIRQNYLRRLPECLTIQLLRFNFDSASKKIRKIHTPISIPLNDLDLKSTTYDASVEREDMSGLSKQHHYSLYALSLHIGGDSTHTGHYIAYCKAINGDWYRFDDEMVRLIRDMQIEVDRPQVKENSYLLFYRKQHLTQDGSNKSK